MRWGAGFASERSCLRQVLHARLPLESGLLVSLRRLSSVSKPASAGAAELGWAVKVQNCRVGRWAGGSAWFVDSFSARGWKEGGVPVGAFLYGDLSVL